MKDKPEHIQRSLWEAGSRSRISALQKLLTYKLNDVYSQVAVKYRRNVGSLSIDMSANNRTTTLRRHIDQHIGRVSVDISTDARSICRPINRATHLDWHIDWPSTDMSTDILVNTRLICRPICRSRGAQNTHDPSSLQESSCTTTYTLTPFEQEMLQLNLLSLGGREYSLLS